MTLSVTLRYVCPRCQAPNRQASVSISTGVSCSACSWSREITSEVLGTQALTGCLVCPTEDLWRQKDFPQALGLTFVCVGVVGSLIAWYYHRPIVALGVLLAVAAVDYVLFAVMPDVLVCYRCGARHSGGEIGDHPAYDHETAERYRQERLRRDEAESMSPEKSR